MAWINEAHAQKMIQRVRGGIKGEFAVRIILTPPDKRQRDIDNYHKAILDFAQASGLVVNDSFCQKLDIAWDRDKGTTAGARLILSEW